MSSELYHTLVACIVGSILAFTAVVLNVLVILALRNIPSLPRKTLKTLLLSMSVSDLGVGLVAQPQRGEFHVSHDASLPTILSTATPGGQVISTWTR